MNDVFISIGSNIGERHRYLKESIELLKDRADTTVEQVSSIYETEPVGYTDQANFLNVVILIRTSLSAGDLLDVCQGIEQTLGRERTIRWGPRTVDLDILLYNQEKIEKEDLIVPHPRMAERAFVLIPLLEIAPDIKSPVTGEPYSERAEIHDAGVTVWSEKKAL